MARLPTGLGAGRRAVRTALFGGPVRGLGETAILVGCGLYGLVVFGPLGAVVWPTMRFVRLGGGQALASSIALGERWTLLVRSAGLALAVSLSSLALGILVATVLTRWRTGRRSVLRWLPLLLAPVPAYVHALAWTAAAYRWNEALARWGWLQVPLRGWGGAWWVEVMSLLPVAAGVSLLALEQAPAVLVEAGRLLAPEEVVLWRVQLRLARPLLVAAAAVLFLLSLLDYGVPALFQVNVYPLAVFAEYSATNEVPRAVLMAAPLVAVAAVAVLASQAGLRALGRRARRYGAPGETLPTWQPWFRMLQGAALVVLAAHLFVPGAVLLRQIRSPQAFWLTIHAARDEIQLTTALALVVAVLSLPIGLGAARPLLRRDRVGAAWWLAVTAPLALPAPLVGIGLIAIWSTIVALPVYGTPLMPVLASLARFLPFATLAVLGQLRQVDPLLLDAARVHQAGPWQALVQVRLPMLTPGLLAAFGIAFALTVGELGATLLVLPPGQATLSVRIYNYLHYGASDAVASLCLLLALAAALAGALAALAVLAWSRLLPATGCPER